MMRKMIQSVSVTVLLTSGLTVVHAVPAESMIQSASAANETVVQLKLNGAYFATAVKPIYSNGVVTLPITSVLKNLKYPYQISGNKLIVTNNDRTVVLTSGSNKAIVDGKTVTLKGKVTKQGSVFQAPMETVRLVSKTGTLKYYEASETVVMNVPVFKKATVKKTSTTTKSSSSRSSSSSGKKYNKIPAAFYTWSEEKQYQFALDNYHLFNNTDQYIGEDGVTPGLRGDNQKITAEERARFGGF